MKPLYVEQVDMCLHRFTSHFVSTFSLTLTVWPGCYSRGQNDLRVRKNESVGDVKARAHVAEQPRSPAAVKL